MSHPQQPANLVDGATWQPWIERRSRLSLIDRQIATSANMALPLLVTLRAERAGILHDLGRTLEARSEYLQALELDPAHLPSLLELGHLLVATGNQRAARMVYEEAVRHHPADLTANVNLAAVLLELHEPEAARDLYTTLLERHPGLSQAHCGMYYALTRLGEVEAAEIHRREGFPQLFIKPLPYRGQSAPIPVLLLVSSNGGNMPIEKLLDDTVFQVYVLVTDFYDPHTPLPEHRLVVNGIGDADLAAEALAAAKAILARTTAPVLNSLEAVRATGRLENAARLAATPGLVTARTQLFPNAVLTAPNGAIELAVRGFRFPLLLRAPGFHMGEHFTWVEDAGQLSAAAAALPAAAGLLAMQYLDARGSDGLHRKYRVMMINGRLYPLHLAISAQWKIHYFSADMADRPDHRAEEARFLADMPTVLGAKAMRALTLLEQQLGLDYGGVDFGLSPTGDVLLFEANATMVVEQPAPDPRWDYRRAAVTRIHDAVRTMLLSRAEAIPGRRQPTPEASLRG
jgi:hypothetical protein